MSNATEIHAEPFVDSLPQAPHATYLRVRRLIEVVVIVAFSPVLLPICLIVALVVMLDSGLPVLYFQDRPGKNGKLFRIAKFRTMTFQKTEVDKITVDNDPRITKYGVFLRHHRLDEIPQFWNVLCGDMSIIGPRPEPYFSAKEFSRTVPFYTERYSIAPGITGWQQVNQGHVNTYEGTCQRVELDRYYIANASLWLDIKIIVMTISTMVRGAKSR